MIYALLIFSSLNLQGSCSKQDLSEYEKRLYAANTCFERMAIRAEMHKSLQTNPVIIPHGCSIATTEKFDRIRVRGISYQRATKEERCRESRIHCRDNKMGKEFVYILDNHATRGGWVQGVDISDDGKHFAISVVHARPFNENLAPQFQFQAGIDIFKIDPLRGGDYVGRIPGNFHLNGWGKDGSLICENTIIQFPLLMACNNLWPSPAPQLIISQK